MNDLLLGFLTGTAFGGFTVSGALAYAAVARQQKGDKR